MRGFHFLVAIFGIRTIKDTQCGFKLFTRSAAQVIFPRMHVERWIFDIEILIIAQMHSMRVVEVPVTWHEVDGTKLEFMKDAIVMFVQLVMIRANYYLGFWKR
jgi:dolichyl-phosphate beta-glucosyltransferase